MKIIHITQSFLPGGGGIENSIHNIVQAIKKKNIYSQEIVSVYRDYKNDTLFDSSYNIVIYRSKSYLFNKSKKLFKNFNSLAGGDKKIDMLGKISMIIIGVTTFFSLFLLSLRRVMNSKDKHIVLHCYSMSTIVVAALIKKILFFKKIRIIFGVHFIYKKSNFNLADYVIKNNLNNVDCFVCVSNAVKKSIISNFNINDDCIKVSYNWMSRKEYAELRNKNSVNFKDKPVKVLMVCRIVPEKGIKEVVELARFLDDNKLSDNFKITVIGDSFHPIKEYLLKESSKISSLNYLGRVEKPSLWEYYKKSHVFLMIPMWEEAFGRTIIESYASGVPVVGLAKGAVFEILNKFPVRGVVKSISPNEIIARINEVILDINRYGYDNFLITSNDVINKNFTESNIEIYIDAYLGK